MSFRALASTVASSPDRDWHVVLVDPDDSLPSQRKSRTGRRTVVRYGSHRYRAALDAASVVVTNGPLPREFVRRDDQTVVVTWDGRTSWSRHDADRDAADAHSDLLRTVLISDVLVSSGPECTARFRAGELRIDGLYDGIVIEPRDPDVDPTAEQCERVMAVLAGGEDTAGNRRLSGDSRTRILVYLGPMETNGITSSGRNLLSQLDHDTFDVTVIFPADCPVERLVRVDRRARLLGWLGPMGLNREQTEARMRFQELGLSHVDVDVPQVAQIFQREWTRLFGRLRFDHVVNFEGYSPFWAMLLSSAPCRRAIWLHNEMWADAHKSVGGEQPNRDRLLSVFSTYGGYDELVSVSEPLRDVNVDELAAYAEPEAFTWIPNLLAPVVSGARDSGVPEAEHAGGTGPSVDILAPGSGRELQTHGQLAVEPVPTRLASVRHWIPVGSGPVVVTVGRLSPEKGHDLLLEAFARLLEVQPDAILLLLGDGPDRSRLEAMARELEIAAHVTFTGYTEHVADVLASADCFVLSSRHEGAPMVILEARALGVPVVATTFRTVGGVLSGRGTEVVERDARLLARSMAVALTPSGRAELLSAQELDVSTWNAAALARFGEVFSRE